MFSYRENDNRIGVYLDNAETSSIPEKNSNYLIDKIVCDNDAEASWDNVNWSLTVTNLSKRSNCKLYFRSKKDITITYDNNYVKNNIFYNTYGLSFNRNSIYSSNTTASLTQKDGTYYYKFIAKSDETGTSSSAGFWNSLKSGRLDSTKKYTIQFEAIGNEWFSAGIGSEQMPLTDGEIPWSSITTKWQKYSYTFFPRASGAAAFVFYGWISLGRERRLEVRNIFLQEGEYDNYSSITLKEYDNLGNLSNPTRDGYTFLGWYTEPIDGEKISDSTLATEDTTYYAHWQYNG